MGGGVGREEGEIPFLQKAQIKGGIQASKGRRHASCGPVGGELKERYYFVSKNEAQTVLQSAFGLAKEFLSYSLFTSYLSPLSSPCFPRYSPVINQLAVKGSLGSLLSCVCIQPLHRTLIISI